jgi:hypothetical protein
MLPSHAKAIYMLIKYFELSFLETKIVAKHLDLYYVDLI